MGVARRGYLWAMLVAFSVIPVGVGQAADGSAGRFQLAYGSLSGVTDSSATKGAELADYWRAEITRGENGSLTGVIKVGVGADSRLVRFAGQMDASGAMSGTILDKAGKRVGRFEGTRSSAGASGTFHAGRLSGNWTWPSDGRN